MEKFFAKYRTAAIITGAFVVFVTLVAPGNLVKSGIIKRNIRTMEREREVYRERAREDSVFMENLKDDEFLEKYARETFYMKRHGEEIYLVGK